MTKIQKFETRKEKGERKIWWVFGELDHFNFGFVSNFDIRTSDLRVANCRLYMTVSNNT